MEDLSFPSFPFGNPDHEQLNSMILDESSGNNLLGGSPFSKTVASLYLQDSQVLLGGSIPFPVAESCGNNTGSFVDIQSVHDAFMDLEKSVCLNDGKVGAHISRLKKLMDDEVKFSNPRTTAQFPLRFQGNEKWRQSAPSIQQKYICQNDTYR